MRTSDNGTINRKYSDGYVNYGDSGRVTGEKTDGSWFTSAGGTGSNGYGSGGSARKSTGRSAGASGAGYDYAGALAQQYAARQAAAAAARDAMTGAARQNYESAMGMLDANYKYNTQNVNDQTAKSMQEAYINKMMNERNLNQQLAANGRSGGAAETTMLNLANNYGNTRGELDTTRNDQLAQLALALQNSKAEQAQQLNSMLAQYESQYQNNLLGYSDNFYSGMQGLAESGKLALSNIANENATMAQKVQGALQQAAAESLAGQVSRGSIDNTTSALQAVTANTPKNTAFYDDYYNAKQAALKAKMPGVMWDLL